MPVPATDVTAAVRAIIGDKSSLIVEDTEMLTYLRMAARDIARRTKVLKQVATLSEATVAAQGYVVFDGIAAGTGVAEIDEVIITGSGQVKELQYASNDLLRQLFTDLTAQGFPEYYSVTRSDAAADTLTLFLYPVPNLSTFTLTISYYLIPTLATVATAIQLPVDYQHAVFLFVLWKCRQQLEQWEQGEVAKRDYELEVASLEYDVHSIDGEYPSIRVLPGDYGDSLYGPY